mmetsp:Transcript_66890/g.192301  ORF Transcript_66890/g.192301 Transcript_66890/m.192301 type:complete len:492 (-) Transcript_66890:56-1531(-)
MVCPFNSPRSKVWMAFLASMARSKVTKATPRSTSQRMTRPLSSKASLMSRRSKSRGTLVTLMRVPLVSVLAGGARSVGLIHVSSSLRLAGNLSPLSQDGGGALSRSLALPPLPHASGAPQRPSSRPPLPMSEGHLPPPPFALYASSRLPRPQPKSPARAGGASQESPRMRFAGRPQSSPLPVLLLPAAHPSPPQLPLPPPLAPPPLAPPPLPPHGSQLPAPLPAALPPLAPFSFLASPLALALPFALALPLALPLAFGSTFFFRLVPSRFSFRRMRRPPRRPSLPSSAFAPLFPSAFFSVLLPLPPLTSVLQMSSKVIDNFAAVLSTEPFGCAAAAAAGAFFAVRSTRPPPPAGLETLGVMEPRAFAATAAMAVRPCCEGVVPVAVAFAAAAAALFAMEMAATATPFANFRRPSNPSRLGPGPSFGFGGSAFFSAILLFTGMIFLPAMVLPFLSALPPRLLPPPFLIMSSKAMSRVLDDMAARPSGTQCGS